MTRVTKLFPVFTVRDLDEGLAYYTDTLGFSISWRWGDPASRAGVALDDIEIQLEAAGLGAPPGPSVVYCHLTDVDAYYEACRGRGATIAMDLGDRPWGMRDFRVVDPSGNRIGFGALRLQGARLPMAAPVKTGVERSIRACLSIAGVIHLAPLIGALGSDRLTVLYGIPIDGPDLTILMRHRAVLFGILGALLIAGAFRASLRNTALLAGVTSVATFLVLALTTRGYNARLGGVVAADVVALLLLLVAAVLQVSRPGKTG